MRVLFISNLFPPNHIGGYEVLCSQVAGLFAERGHDVHVLTSCYGGKVSVSPHITISQGLRLICGQTIYLPFNLGYTRQTVIEADNAVVTRQLIQRLKPDVIFAWNLHGLHKQYFNNIGAVGVPLVVMLTDNWLAAMFSPDFVDRYFKQNVYGEQLGRESEPAANSVQLMASAIFGSSYMQDLYKSSGLRFSDSVVIHNGVELSDDLRLGRQSRASLSDGARAPVRLLFAGRLVRLKGVHTVLESLNLLIRRTDLAHLSFYLTIVGDATEKDYMNELASMILHSDLSGQVKFAPPVREADLPALFQDHDIFVFPSLYEPFSLTLIHAMASGIPTIASAVGGNVEIVIDRETGLTFPPGDAGRLADAIGRVAVDGELRERLSYAGRAKAATFTVDRMVDQMEAYLTEQVQSEP